MEKLYMVYNYGNNTPNWCVVPKLIIGEFPWYNEGKKQMTQVQCALSQNMIYLKVESEDAFIKGEAKQLNDPVYADSCVEFFVTPNPHKGDAYFNIEMSCNGTLYLAYKDNTEDRVVVSEAEAKKISIQTCFEKTDGWELTASIPIEVLEKMSGEKFNTNTWYGNFYRCGGSKEQQYACWNKISWPVPAFHRPEQFGKLVICKA